jgi:hypothetical protein
MWYWWVGAIIVWLASAICIISTMVELKQGKTGPVGPKAGEFWGAVVFHGATAILVLWLLLKALGKA